MADNSSTITKRLVLGTWIWTRGRHHSGVHAPYFTEEFTYTATGSGFIPTSDNAFGDARLDWNNSDSAFFQSNIRFQPNRIQVLGFLGRGVANLDSFWLAGAASDNSRLLNFAKAGDTTRLAWHAPAMPDPKMDSLYIHKTGLMGGRWTDVSIHFSWDSTIANPLLDGIQTKIAFEGIRETGVKDRLEGRVILMNSAGNSTWSDLQRVTTFWN